MFRILIGECKQEVSSFNPVLSRYEDFAVSHGGEILSYHRGVQQEVGGALSVFESREDIEVVPTYSARAITSGGTLAAEDFNRIASEFLACIKKAPKVDAVYLSLHGAMATGNEDDPEGFLLSEVRKLLGEEIPVVISLDLHGIPTDRMLQHCDAVVMYHTYPHVDFFETGQRAARLLLRILSGEVRPVTAKVFIPALVRGDELITETGLFGQCIRDARAIENSAGGLSAGMFIGNPFTDVTELGTNSLVVTDDDPERAERVAIDLANKFWRVRVRLQASLTSLEESLRIAAETVGRVVLVDAADAPSSGASGDSNAILKGLLETGYDRRALIPIVDPTAVNAATAAGIGRSVRTTVGGALDRTRFQPVEIEARVRLLSDGHFRSESHGDVWESGQTAVLQAGLITLVVTSRAVDMYDRSLFLAHGQDPSQFDLVVVKSPHCQHHFFAAGAERLVNVDAPGSSSANLHSLGHTRCSRPIFPLDEEVPFIPKAKLFRRSY
ncbi:MAG: M81 family metallopeptidase [Acidobacteria bacterium]|nr:M81 family metallopeptidase [Acidobacteriota bacterium]